MPLEYDPTPRFTPDQRDAILDLAARLQVQHEAMVGMDDLVREAEAAGIDARFVVEATVRLDRKARPSKRPRGAALAFSLFAFQAIWTMFVAHSWVHQDRWSVGVPEVILSAGIALLLSLWATRDKNIRSLVPASAFGIWAIVWLSTFVVESQFIGMGYFWVTDTALKLGLLQTLAAVVAVLVRNASEWRPEGARSFRLHRRS